MSGLSELDSAEKVTRYLRDKNVNPREILTVAWAVHKGEISVYLPNKEIILVELLIQRLSEQNNGWRVIEESWELLNSLWVALQARHGGDKSGLERALTNHGILQIVQYTMEDLRTNPSLIHAVSEFFGLVFSLEFPLMPSIDQVTNVFFNFFNLSLQQNTSRLVTTMDTIYNQFLSHTSPKKQKGPAMLKLFEPLYTLVGTTLSEDMRSLVVRIFQRSILGLDLPIKTLSGNKRSSIEIYKELGQFRASYFQSLVELSPDAINDLLEVSLQEQVTLPLDNLKSIISNELTKGPNFQVLETVLKLNSSAVLQNADKLYGAVHSEDAVPFAASFVQVVVSSKDFYKFLTDWKNLSNAWLDDKPKSIVRHGIRNLTQHQVSDILELYGADSLHTPTIIEGIFAFESPSSHLLESLDALFFKCEKQPEIIYLLLNLDGKLGESVERSKDYKVYFRCAEIYDIDMEKPEKVFSKALKSEPNLVLPNVTNRWIQLVNTKLSDKALAHVASCYVENIEQLKQLVDNPLFFEQPRLFSQVLSEMLKRLDGDTLQLLELVPIEAVPRDSRQTILDSVLSLETSNKDDCILKFLERPTYDCILESDAKELLSYFKKSGRSDVVARVIGHHMTDKPDGDFLATLDKRVQKHLKSKENWAVRVYIILCAYNYKTANLKDGSRAILEALKEGDMGTLSVLTDLHTYSKAIKAPGMQAAVGKVLCCTKEPRVQVQAYKYLCAVSTSFQDILCLISVYLAIPGLPEDCLEVSLRNLDGTELLQVLKKTLSVKEHNAVDVICCIGRAATKDTDLTPLFRALDYNDIRMLNLVKLFYREKPWTVTQSQLELMLVKISLVDNTLSQELYLQYLDILKAILLFHRHRITGRHHLVVGAFAALLKPLSALGSSAALAYVRVLDTLCNPLTHGIRDKALGGTGLNSFHTVARRTLAKYIPVLLQSYIMALLQLGYTPETREILRKGFYPVFALIGSGPGLNLVAGPMDHSGRAYFRYAYQDYKRNYRNQDKD